MKKNFFIILILLLLLFIAILFLFFKSKKNIKPNIKIPILLYHDFTTTIPDTDSNNFQYINTPESFEENIKVLLENEYTFLSFKDLNNAYNEKIKLPKKPILITFDDGYISNYQYIYPILKKYNIKAAIFVVTENINKENFLTWEQCKIMKNSGLVEIFSHSKRHLFYNKLSVKTLLDDVNYSYKEIEKHLGKQDLNIFAYPYGAYNKESVWVLKLHKIDMQIYDLGMNYFNNFDKNYIRRINIPCEMTGMEIIEEINSIH